MKDNCMEKIKVSVITVCFNSEKTIENTIRSVLNQTYSNVEYIVVDGKSSDRTMDIVEAYRDRFGTRMKVISEPDEGLYYAMNKGIEIATGEIIGIINSDDYYEFNAIEKVVSKYEENHINPYSVYYGADRAIIDGKEKSITFNNAEFIDQSMISHPASFVTKKTYEKYGAFDTRFYCVADYDMMLRFKHSSDISFIPIYDVLANFTIGGLCSTQRAYFELLDLKVEYGFISKRNALMQKLTGKFGTYLKKLIHKS